MALYHYGYRVIKIIQLIICAKNCSVICYLVNLHLQRKEATLKYVPKFSGGNLVQSLGGEKMFCRPPKVRNLGDGGGLTVSCTAAYFIIADLF